MNRNRRRTEIRGLIVFVALLLSHQGAIADFAITKLTRSPDGAIQIDFESEVGYYYLLIERHGVESPGGFRDVVVGEAESSRFDISPEEGEMRFFSIVRIPKEHPLSDIDPQAAHLIRELSDENPIVDLDGDGLDDRWEVINGFDPSRKDNPTLGLIVYTPLTK